MHSIVLYPESDSPKPVVSKETDLLNCLVFLLHIYWVCIIFILYFYWACIVFVLYFYQISLVLCCISIKFIIVFVLYFDRISIFCTVFLLYLYFLYCISIKFVLYLYCILIGFVIFCTVFLSSLYCMDLMHQAAAYATVPGKFSQLVSSIVGTPWPKLEQNFVLVCLLAMSMF